VNTLSWFLYLADVLPNVSKLLLIFAIIGGIASLVLWPPKTIALLNILFCFLFFLSGLIPSKDTFYAIAASELGEQVIDSPTGQRVKQAIEAWIEQQLPKQAK
jgi:hypothetical protein